MVNFRDIQSISERRKVLEELTSAKFPHIGSYSLDAEQASSRNCENMIGVVQVPVGIAGPLTINSLLQKREVYVPLATTEGALVASINRGCKAICQSGGVSLVSKKVGITRAPVFSVTNLSHGSKTITWIEKNGDRLKNAAESTSAHLRLLGIKSWVVGKNIFIRFAFDAQDAMGMNMATIATQAMAEIIEKETQAALVALSGNVCVDKKPNMLNVIEGRGTQVWAEVFIPEKIIAETLKTTGGKIVEVVQRKIYLGSLLSGSLGANAHAANIIAALFLATGQDIAHVSEVCQVMTTAEQEKSGIRFSVFLPDVVVGTVGGGTSLATQQEALQILGVAGGAAGKNAQKLAEIVGAAVLAGEISLLASLSEHSLVRAHKTLGRGEK